MSEKNIKARVQMKADISENWAKAEGFYPLEREPIFYTDTGAIKLGDGVTSVNDLSQFNVGKKTSAGGEIFNDYNNNIVEQFAFRLIDATRAADGTGTFKIARTESARKVWEKLVVPPAVLKEGLEYSASVAMQVSPGHSNGYLSEINTYKAHDVWEEESWNTDYPLTMYVNSSYISDEPLMTFIYAVGPVPETFEETYSFVYNEIEYKLRIKATETNYLEYAAHDCLGGQDLTPTIQLDYQVELYIEEGEIDPAVFTEPLVYITYAGSQFDCYGEGVKSVSINETTPDGEAEPVIKSAKVENFGKITQLSTCDDYYLITVDKGFSEPNNYFTGNNFYAYESYGEFSDLNTIYFIAEPSIGDVVISTMAHAEGGNNKALSKYAHAEGYGNISYGSYSHTQGIGNEAGYGASASGYGNIASGQVSSANGYETKAMNYRAFTQGFRTNATGRQALATGENTLASGGNSLSAGLNSQAAGFCSVAGGSGSVANADDSKAFGVQAQTDNLEAHLKYPGAASAEGYMTKAFGSYGAHAEGRETEALGQTSHAQGFRTIAAARWQDVMGTLNLVDNRYGVDTAKSGYAQIVGNGYQQIGLEGRSNAYALDWNGNGFYAGDLYVKTTFSDNGNETFSVSGSKVATLTEVNNAKTEAINSFNSLITRDGLGTIKLIAKGDYAYSLQYGNGNTVSQMGGIAFGYATKATNYWATAFGSYAEANGNASFAAGNKAITSTSVKGQVVLGNTNVIDDSAQFIVGCDGKNGFIVTTDGRLKSSSFVGKTGNFVTVGENGELVATEIIVGGTY